MPGVTTLDADKIDGISTSRKARGFIAEELHRMDILKLHDPKKLTVLKSVVDPKTGQPTPTEVPIRQKIDGKIYVPVDKHGNWLLENGMAYNAARDANVDSDGIRHGIIVMDDDHIEQIKDYFREPSHWARLVGLAMASGGFDLGVYEVGKHVGLGIAEAGTETRAITNALLPVPTSTTNLPFPGAEHPSLIGSSAPAPSTNSVMA